MDAGDGARANVIGQVTQHDAVHQRRPKVLGKHNFQPALNALGKEKQKQTMQLLRLMEQNDLLTVRNNLSTEFSPRTKHDRPCDKLATYPKTPAKPLSAGQAGMENE